MPAPLLAPAARGPGMAAAPLFAGELELFPARVVIGLEAVLAKLAAEVDEFAVAEGAKFVAEGFETVLAKGNHGKLREERGRGSVTEGGGGAVRAEGREHGSEDPPLQSKEPKRDPSLRSG